MINIQNNDSDDVYCSLNPEPTLIPIDSKVVIINSNNSVFILV